MNDPVDDPVEDPVEDPFNKYDKLFTNGLTKNDDDSLQSQINYRKREYIFNMLKQIWDFFKICKNPIRVKSREESREELEESEESEEVEIKIPKKNSLRCTDSQLTVANCFISTFTNALMTLVVELANKELSGKYYNLINCINNISNDLLSNSTYLFFLLLFEDFTIDDINLYFQCLWKSSSSLEYIKKSCKNFETFKLSLLLWFSIKDMFEKLYVVSRKLNSGDHIGRKEPFDVEHLITNNQLFKRHADIRVDFNGGDNNICLIMNVSSNFTDLYSKILRLYYREILGLPEELIEETLRKFLEKIIISSQVDSDLEHYPLDEIFRCYLSKYKTRTAIFIKDHKWSFYSLDKLYIVGSNSKLYKRIKTIGNKFKHIGLSNMNVTWSILNQSHFYKTIDSYKKGDTFNDPYTVTGGHIMRVKYYFGLDGEINKLLITDSCGKITELDGPILKNYLDTFHVAQIMVFVPYYKDNYKDNNNEHLPSPKKRIKLSVEPSVGGSKKKSHKKRRSKNHSKKSHKKRRSKNHSNKSHKKRRSKNHSKKSHKKRIKTLKYNHK